VKKGIKKPIYQNNKEIFLASSLCSYSISHLQYKDKIRFYYALKGRDGSSGLLPASGIKQLAKSVLLINKQQEKQVNDFLKFWKCKTKFLKISSPSTSPNSILISYKISHLQYKDKIRFYYALKGRDGSSGILANKKLIQLAKTALLVPLELDSEFQDFLRHWNCKFSRIKVRLENE